ncbi:hypothetical protein FKM82_031170 [Ascaphus truei]
MDFPPLTLAVMFPLQNILAVKGLDLPSAQAFKSDIPNFNMNKGEFAGKTSLCSRLLDVFLLVLFINPNFWRLHGISTNTPNQEKPRKPPQANAMGCQME